jgi:hypothetical protein
MKEQTWQQWARTAQRDQSSPSRIKKGSLAALTGTDVRALDAFVACVKLYAYTNDRRALDGARVAANLMQDSTRWVAKELVAFVLDWSDRDRIWSFLYVVPP